MLIGTPDNTQKTQIGNRKSEIGNFIIFVPLYDRWTDLRWLQPRKKMLKRYPPAALPTIRPCHC